MRPHAEKLDRPLTFRSGGWVLLGALALSMVLVIWAVAGVFCGAGRSPGDGKTIESYGFDLAGLSVPRSTVRPAMPRRDMVTPIDDPIIVTGREVAELAPRRGKYLVPTDRVVGVKIGDEARAYPITVLNVHEIVHDTLGGREIAVTYSWPCDSVAVYERQLDGDTLSFGLSGLLCNANMLMYDRGSESLWVQITGEAVSGPKAGATLRRVPSTLASWEQWLTLHPETTVVNRDPTIVKRRYNKADPNLYFRGYTPLHPIDPPPPTPPVAMEPVVVVSAGGTRRVYPRSLIAERSDDEGVWRVDLAGTEVSFWYSPAAETVYVSGAGARYALWFAWNAFSPGDDVAR